MRALDLRNTAFGELTALTPEIRDKKRGWVCKCSCGEIKWYATFQLTSGNAKTCNAEFHRHSIKIGDVFGKLIVTAVKRDKNDGRFLAECLCECGTHKPNIKFKDLQRSTTTHCGCSRDTSHLGLPVGVAILNALISTYKNNAKNRGLVFSLTLDECVMLFKNNCYYCGQLPSRVLKKKNIKGEYIYSGIDRTDSKLGYTINNVVSCCSECNYFKSNIPIDLFINRIEKIYLNLNK